MSTVEAAASLFGPEEPASDPFATLGTDTPASPSTNDPFIGHENIPPSDFFGLGPDRSFPSHTGEAPSDSRSGPAAFGPYDSQVASYSQDPSSANYSQAQGWHDELGKFRVHEQLLPETSPAGNVILSIQFFF